MRISLSDQITALEGMTTNTPEQGAAKTAILQTLRKLAAIRQQFERDQPNENVIVQLWVEALGEEFPKPARPSGHRS